MSLAMLCGDTGGLQGKALALELCRQDVVSGENCARLGEELALRVILCCQVPHDGARLKYRQVTR